MRSIRSPDGRTKEICQVSVLLGRRGVAAYLDLGVVLDGGLPIDGGHHHLEDPKGILRHRMRLSAPLVCHSSVRHPAAGRLVHGGGRNTEFTDEERLRRVGRPLSVADVVLAVDADAEFLEALERVSLEP